MRKARAGQTVEGLVREKRMGDLAWQMRITEQKLSTCPREKRSAKERLAKLYNEAKLEYNRLVSDIEVENAPETYGVYLG